MVDSFVTSGARLDVTPGEIEQWLIQWWKKLWNKLVSPQVSVLCWLVRERKTLTIDKLRRRGLVIVNGCSMCLNAEETSNHLFIHCRFARRVWSAIFRRFGVTWVMLCSISDLFLQWRVTGTLMRWKILWHLSLFAGVCKIWLEINNSIIKLVRWMRLLKLFFGRFRNGCIVIRSSLVYLRMIKCYLGKLASVVVG